MYINESGNNTPLTTNNHNNNNNQQTEYLQLLADISKCEQVLPPGEEWMDLDDVLNATSISNVESTAGDAAMDISGSIVAKKQKYEQKQQQLQQQLQQEHQSSIGDVEEGMLGIEFPLAATTITSEGDDSSRSSQIEVIPMEGIDPLTYDDTLSRAAAASTTISITTTDNSPPPPSFVTSANPEQLLVSTTRDTRSSSRSPPIVRLSPSSSPTQSQTEQSTTPPTSSPSGSPLPTPAQTSPASSPPTSERPTIGSVSPRLTTSLKMKKRTSVADLITKKYYVRSIRFTPLFCANFLCFY